MTSINYFFFIWNVFVDTLLLLIVYAWKMYDMQTLHAGGIPMFRGTYLIISRGAAGPGREILQRPPSVRLSVCLSVCLSVRLSVRHV